MSGHIEIEAYTKPVNSKKPKAAETTESDAILSAFEQINRINKGTIKTRSANALLEEYDY